MKLFDRLKRKLKVLRYYTAVEHWNTLNQCDQFPPKIESYGHLVKMYACFDFNKDVLLNFTRGHEAYVQNLVQRKAETLSSLANVHPTDLALVSVDLPLTQSDGELYFKVSTDLGSVYGLYPFIVGPFYRVQLPTPSPDSSGKR